MVLIVLGIAYDVAQRGKRAQQAGAVRGRLLIVVEQFSNFVILLFCYRCVLRCVSVFGDVWIAVLRYHVIENCFSR